MILLDRVSKNYNRRNAPALERISLHVEPKEFVIIVGQSGAGKSTLFKLLTREEKPTSGKIIVGGIDYDKLSDKDVPLLLYATGHGVESDRTDGLVLWLDSAEIPSLGSPLP